MRKGRSCKGRKSVWIMHKIAIFRKKRAFCSKTDFVLQQNTTLFAAKRKVKCCKTQGKMQQNARQNGAKCKAKCINTQNKMHYYAHNLAFYYL